MKKTNLKMAIEDILAGKAIVLADDSTRENECDLVIGAKFVTPETIRFFTKYTSGLMCVAIDQERMKKLKIPSLVKNIDYSTTFYAMPVDATSNITTGISSFDRAQTIRTLADPDATAEDLKYPGHMSIVYGDKNGLKGRRGHTEASIRLLELAGIRPNVALISEIVDRDSNPISSKRVKEIADALSLSFTSVSDIVEANSTQKTLTQVNCKTAAILHTLYGTYKIYIFTSPNSKYEYPVLSYIGDKKNGDNFEEINRDEALNVRVHSGCFTGNTFFSQICDCYEQLYKSMSYIEKKKNGLIIYLPDHEGRGIGLSNKIKAYAIQQNSGLDTVEANLALNLPIDQRNYSIAAAIINSFNPNTINLISNNPQKAKELAEEGIKINNKLVHLEIKPNKYNTEYLCTKKKKMGHNFF